MWQKLMKRVLSLVLFFSFHFLEEDKANKTIKMPYFA